MDSTEQYTVQTSGSGVATPGTDFDTLSESASFAAGESYVDVEVMADLDAYTESPETVTVTVDEAAAYDPGDDDEATLTISDPPPPAVSVYRLSDAAEGESGSFLFTRTGDLSAALTVTYTVETVGPGLATPGGDYASLSGSVTIPAGEASVVVAVDASTDSSTEGAEAVTVHIGTSSNYDIGEGAATLFVTDDQAVVWIDSSPSSVDENDSGDIVLKRSGGNLDEGLVVPVNISVGDDEDLVWVSDFSMTGISGDWSGWNTVTFPAGVDTVVLTLAAVLDDVSDGGEEVEIELDAGNSAFAVGLVSSVAVTIANVVPNIQFPAVQAGEPLNTIQAGLLADHLREYGEYGMENSRRAGRGLTTAQYNEMMGYLNRFRQFGLQADGAQRLGQFQNIIGALTAVPHPISGAINIYSQVTDRIVQVTSAAQENSYQQFRLAMGGTTGNQAAQRFQEIRASYSQTWVDTFWVRYQAEKLRLRYN